MHQSVSAPVAAAPDRVGAIIGDLSTYPEWLDLVTAAESVSGEGAQPAWHVTIRAKVGPFARSKKLRMVRTLHETNADGSTYRFERREIDGRDHSAWTLDASVRSTEKGSSHVAMDLRYDGGLWVAPLEPILGSFIDGAGPDLEAYANQR